MAGFLSRPGQKVVKELAAEGCGRRELGHAHPKPPSPLWFPPGVPLHVLKAWRGLSGFLSI